MRNSYVISFIIHMVFIGCMFMLRSTQKTWVLPAKIINVELVRAVMKPKQVEINQTDLKSKPKPIKEPEVGVAKSNKRPDREISEKPKKEPPKTGALVGPEKSSSAESSGDQIKLDAKEFPFSYYLRLLVTRIRENWRPVRGSSELNQRLNSVVAFQILRHGEIRSVLLETSSGNYLFDQAAQRAIYSIKNLPPLPEDYREESLTVHLEFESLQ